MKRDRPIDSDDTPITPASASKTDSGDMACPHLTAAFANLAPPRPSQAVHREECTLCFDGQDHPGGVDVCLVCFNGACSGEGSLNHSALHFSKSSHALVVNVKRKLKPAPQQPDGTRPPPPKKLAIAAEIEEDKYEFITTPKCLACASGGEHEGGKELPRTEKLEEVISGVMKALSSAQQSEVKAWEEEIESCSHTRDLPQLPDAQRLDSRVLTKCGKCDLESNLWLCLTCGNLGCGRAQFGGVGGNSHGLAHFEETGHPCSVKQGTITAEGTADIYCYPCNDARLAPNLAQYLAHLGINVMSLSKTEKSMTELQIEQNLKFDFNMTGDDGKELEPLFGPGLTGLSNLGNSCYMASVLQALFALPAFHSRYVDAYKPHTLGCINPLPASCVECQTAKIADGLASGRYSVPRPVQPPAPGSMETDHEGPIFQAGIRPSMFKALIGKGHEEFATMRQQDADEFFKHLVGVLQRESKRLTSTEAASGSPTHDATQVFSFVLQQRLQCTVCNGVRYSTETQDAGLPLPVPLRPISKAPEQLTAAEKGKVSAEGIDAAPSVPVSDPDKVSYDPVSLIECLDLFTAPESLEYRCPACDKDVIATKQTLFLTFPEVLVIQARRFQLINWVPQKVDVPIIVPLDNFDLDKYLGTGKKDDEIELPQDKAATAAAQAPQFDAGAMAQLTGMGFPDIRCQRALLATGNTGDADAAMNWLFAHMEDVDIDDPIDFSKIAPAGGISASAVPDTSMLEEMGFSKAQAVKALRVNGNNAEIAVAWLFENPDDPGEEPGAVTSDGGEPSGQGEQVALGGSSNLPARYRIKSFISHKGPSVHSGHYVAHIRRSASTVTGHSGTGPDEDAWVFFNDEKVVKAPFTSASVSTGADATQSDVGVKGLSALAYEYFFERQN